jgi:hypothetical protein
MRDSSVGERKISDFAKINHVFQDSWASSGKTPGVVVRQLIM